MEFLFARQEPPPVAGGATGDIPSPSGSTKAPVPQTPHSASYFSLQVGYVVPFGIATLFMIGRLYARKVLIKSWGADDSFISLAWMFGTANIILSCVQSAYSVGSSTFGQTNKSRFASQLVYFRNISFLLCISLTKISTCFFYRRVFDDFLSRMFIYGTMVVITIYTTVFECLIIFQCRPVSKGFDQTQDGTCISIVPTFYAISVANIISDVWLILFVVPRVLKLRMPKKQKAILICVITLSWMVVAAALIRLIKTSASINSTDSASKAAYSPNIWISIEMSVGIFCVSSPCIKPVLQKYAPGLLSSFTSSQNHASYTSKSRIATYVRSGRSKSRLDANDAIELRSQPDLEQSHTWSTQDMDMRNSGRQKPLKSNIVTTTTITMSEERANMEGKLPADITREYQKHYYEN